MANSLGRLQKISVFLILSFNPFFSISQTLDSSEFKKYDRKFKSKKGVYLNFENFKTNNPIPPIKIISKHSFDGDDYFKKLMSEKLFSYINDVGDTISILSQSIWGYSDNDGIYLLPKKHLTKIGDEQYVPIQNKIIPQKLFIIGKMSAFYEIDETVVYVPGLTTPNGINQSEPVSKNKLIPYILNYDSGIVIQYDLEKLEEKIRQEDVELYNEYRKSKVQKSSRVWVLISMYNEKYPIFFPISK